MEKFEIFKLKEAGLSNEQVLRVLDYCRKDQALPSLEEIARIARCRSIIHFVDKYRQLDEEHLHNAFFFVCACVQAASRVLLPL